MAPGNAALLEALRARGAQLFAEVKRSNFEKGGVAADCARLVSDPLQLFAAHFAALEAAATPLAQVQKLKLHSQFALSVFVRNKVKPEAFELAAGAACYAVSDNSGLGLLVVDSAKTPAVGALAPKSKYFITHLLLQVVCGRVFCELTPASVITENYAHYASAEAPLHAIPHVSSRDCSNRVL